MGRHKRIKLCLTNPRKITDLPPEIIAQIYQYVHELCRIKIGYVSKYFYLVLKNNPMVNIDIKDIFNAVGLVPKANKFIWLENLKRGKQSLFVRKLFNKLKNINTSNTRKLCIGEVYRLSIEVLVKLLIKFPKLEMLDLSRLDRITVKKRERKYVDDSYKPLKKIVSNLKRLYTRGYKSDKFFQFVKKHKSDKLIIVKAKSKCYSCGHTNVSESSKWSKCIKCSNLFCCYCTRKRKKLAQAAFDFKFGPRLFGYKSCICFWCSSRPKCIICDRNSWTGKCSLCKIPCCNQYVPPYLDNDGDDGNDKKEFSFNDHLLERSKQKYCSLLCVKCKRLICSKCKPINGTNRSNICSDCPSNPEEMFLSNIRKDAKGKCYLQ